MRNIFSKGGNVRTMANNTTPMKIAEIADALGISKTTVSRALSGKGRVGEETRARVFAYAGLTGREVAPPHPVTQGATHNLSLIIPKHFIRLDLPFLRKCMGGICAMAAQRGYDLLSAMSARPTPTNWNASWQAIKLMVSSFPAPCRMTPASTC